MAHSDATIFFENLKMWDRPEETTKDSRILQFDDNVERIVDEMFDRFCDMEIDKPHSLVGNC